MQRLYKLVMVLLVLLLAVVPAWAGQRQFVSNNGNDANLCTLASPCRTFARAVTVTDAGGEVVVLDTAGYGPVTISKSLSIIAPPGVYAGITAPSAASGITINAGASDKVSLKGLTIKGSQDSYDGITVLAVGTLVIENCSLSGNGSGAGVFFNAPNSRFIMIRSEAKGWVIGTNLNAPYMGSTVDAVLDNVQLDGNTMYGLYVTPSGGSTIKATVSNCTANNNGAAGVMAQEQFGGDSKTVLNLERCVASNNFEFGIYALHSNSQSFTSISNCTITNNGAGVFRLDLGPGTGTVYTRQNNTIIGNVIDVDGIVTAFPGL